MGDSYKSQVIAAAAQAGLCSECPYAAEMIQKADQLDKEEQADSDRTDKQLEQLYYEPGISEVARKDRLTIDTRQDQVSLRVGRQERRIRTINSSVLNILNLRDQMQVQPCSGSLSEADLPLPKFSEGLVEQLEHIKRSLGEIVVTKPPHRCDLDYRRTKEMIRKFFGAQVEFPDDPI